MEMRHKVRLSKLPRYTVIETKDAGFPRLPNMMWLKVSRDRWRAVDDNLVMTNGELQDSEEFTFVRILSLPKENWSEEVDTADWVESVRVK